MLDAFILEVKGPVSRINQETKTIKALKWLLSATSNNPRHYVFKNIVKTTIRGEDCLCATDGRRMHALRLERLKEFPEGIEYNKPYRLTIADDYASFQVKDVYFPDLTIALKCLEDIDKMAIRLENRDAVCSAIGHLGLYISADYVKDAVSLGKEFCIYKCAKEHAVITFSEGFALIAGLHPEVRSIDVEDKFPFPAPPPNFSPDWSLNTPDAGTVEAEVCCG